MDQDRARFAPTMDEWKEEQDAQPSSEGSATRLRRKPQAAPAVSDATDSGSPTLSPDRRTTSTTTAGSGTFSPAVAVSFCRKRAAAAANALSANNYALVKTVAIFILADIILNFILTFTPFFANDRAYAFFTLRSQSRPADAGRSLLEKTVGADDWRSICLQLQEVLIDKDFSILDTKMHEFMASARDLHYTKCNALGIKLPLPGYLKL